ncbi:hypothetical protein LY90DRAFT_361271, partial [Neocallimastix californiae]
MYNGIGLTTPRGSGTNGFVQRNLSHIPNRPKRDFKDYNEMAPPPPVKKVDKSIAVHDKKREIEIKCIELQDELEEKGEKEDVIVEKVSKLRKKLTEEL